jgi:CelD/BcsL family acetyltransferase involved in cellulose biosynthesis
MATPTPAAQSRASKTSLAFRIGPWVLWYWRFDALIDDRHFTQFSPQEAIDAIESGVLESACRLLPAYPIAAAPATLRTDDRWIVYTPRVFPNYFVDLRLEGGFPAYLQRFSSKSRSSLRRKLRRFAEADTTGEIRRTVYRTPGEIEQFLSIAGALSDKTYQARILDVGLPKSAEFRLRALERARTDDVRGFVLWLNGQAAAYVYTTFRNGVASYDFVGHDPALNALSPGTVLQYHVLEHLFGEPRLDVFDFTEGEGEHKAFFSTDRQLCAKSFVFPRRRSLLALVRLHAWLADADKLLDRTLERLAIKQRIRRYVRSA